MDATKGFPWRNHAARLEQQWQSEIDTLRRRDVVHRRTGRHSQRPFDELLQDVGYHDHARRFAGAIMDLAAMTLGGTQAATVVQKVVGDPDRSYRPLLGDSHLAWPYPTGAAASAFARGEWTNRSWQLFRRNVLSPFIAEQLEAVALAGIASQSPAMASRPAYWRDCASCGQRAFRSDCAPYALPETCSACGDRLEDPTFTL